MKKITTISILRFLLSNFEIQISEKGKQRLEYRGHNSEFRFRSSDSTWNAEDRV